MTTQLLPASEELACELNACAVDVSEEKLAIALVCVCVCVCVCVRVCVCVCRSKPHLNSLPSKGSKDCGAGLKPMLPSAHTHVAR